MNVLFFFLSTSSFYSWVQPDWTYLHFEHKSGGSNMAACTQLYLQ